MLGSLPLHDGNPTSPRTANNSRNCDGVAQLNREKEAAFRMPAAAFDAYVAGKQKHCWLSFAMEFATEWGECGDALDDEEVEVNDHEDEDFDLPQRNI